MKKERWEKGGKKYKHMNVFEKYNKILSTPKKIAKFKFETEFS